MPRRDARARRCAAIGDRLRPRAAPSGRRKRRERAGAWRARAEVVIIPAAGGTPLQRLRALAVAALGLVALGNTCGPIGTDEIVLPGFTAIAVKGTTVTLGAGRSYVWSGSFLPAEIDAAGDPLAGPMNLRLRVGGSSILLAPSQVTVLESTPHHAVIRADGQPYPNLTVSATTRIEFDGVAMVAITVTPTGAVDVQGLDQEVDVLSTSATRMLKFQAGTIRSQNRAQQILPSYSGAFLNAVGLADGDRSFWWFADNAIGWIWNGPTVTELTTPASGRLRLTQHLIGSSFRISAPMQFQFNFLATPVKDLGSAWRKQRVTAGVAPSEVGLGTIQLSWQAFAHFLFPYTSYPPGVEAQIPQADLDAYRGLQANKALMESYLAVYGIQLLPELSLHCLPQIDPALAVMRSSWEVQPPFVFTQTEPPWTAIFDKPALSHRASDFTNYLVTRIAAELDNLGMRGLFLDQASVLDSANPANGSWTDSNGQTRPSLDILGTREFLRRTRNVFALKGMPGYLFVHASNSELIPAYTFATAVVDGEQFRTSLWQDDYIATIPLDQTRMQFAPDQYGVRSAWISEFGYAHSGDPNWSGSAAELKAFRNMMTLVLLHDAELVPVAVPYAARSSILQALDDFGTDQAAFVGYWRKDPAATALDTASQVSFYRRSGPTAALLVVGNLYGSARNIHVAVDPVAMGFAGTPGATAVSSGQTLPIANGRLTVPVNGKDFELVRIE